VGAAVCVPAELLKENKRMLDKAIRELDRERTSLQNQEKKLIGEIKKSAKAGQMVSCEKGPAVALRFVSATGGCGS
jgi:hypothetical protein